jgi:alpha 1,3-glucosidase
VYSGGVTRIRIVEPSAKRHEVPDVLTSEHASRHRKWESIAHQRELRRTRLVAGDVELHVDDSPLALRLFRNGREFGNLNANGLLAIEHTRLRGREQNDTDAMWSESFGGATDSKPRGPQALSVDASFPHASNVYGLPDRLQKLSLPSTIDSDGNPTAEPYRLYNLDIPHFESDNNFALYGSVPFAIAHSAQNGSAGLFFLNSAEMYVDVRRTAWDGEKQDEGSGNVSDTQQSESGINLRWLAESGIVDLFFLPGPSPKDVSAQYAMLTGSTDLPQEFALGFHQCRWNYRDQKDLLAVNNNFDNFDMPADVLWLDIEHTDKKKYITWDTCASKRHITNPFIQCLSYD